MTVRRLFVSVSLPAVLALAACGQQEKTDAPAEKAAAEAPAPSPLAETPAPAAAPARAAIRTNPGPDGSQVDLVRAQVTGNVLTVELSYRPASTKTEWVYLNADEVSVIDDTTSQRYGVLKDNTSQWLAAPLQSATSNRLSASLSEGRPSIIWFKFPAPPATSPTISINVPNVSPFDGVPVQR